MAKRKDSNKIEGDGKAGGPQEVEGKALRFTGRAPRGGKRGRGQDGEDDSGEEERPDCWEVEGGDEARVLNSRIKVGRYIDGVLEGARTGRATAAMVAGIAPLLRLRLDVVRELELEERERREREKRLAGGSLPPPPSMRVTRTETTVEMSGGDIDHLLPPALPPPPRRIVEDFLVPDYLSPGCGPAEAGLERLLIEANIDPAAP